MWEEEIMRYRRNGRNRRTGRRGRQGISKGGVRGDVAESDGRWLHNV